MVMGSKFKKEAIFAIFMLQVLRISETVADRVKRTKIWDYKGYKSQITNIFENSNFFKKKSKCQT